MLPSYLQWPCHTYLALSGNKGTKFKNTSHKKWYKFEVVEIEETSKENPKAAKEESKERAEAKEKDKLKPPKKQRFVVIYEDFQLEDIGALSKYRDLRVYYVNRR